MTPRKGEGENFLHMGFSFTYELTNIMEITLYLTLILTITLDIKY